MTHTTTLRRHPTVKPNGRGLVLPAHDPAVRYGRTLFPSRVYDVDEVARVLKDGHQSRKIGKVVQKGRLKGAPIYTLTLEERATCPRTCREWASCYGNNMQAAERLVAGPALESALLLELYGHAKANPDGFLVRLHVLGDFYSTDYVAHWSMLLGLFPALNVFGFTAHDAKSDIGHAVQMLNASHPDRCHIRFSGTSGGDGALVVEPGEDTPHVVCPAQTGASECCATCSLCWTMKDRPIAFVRH